MERIKTRFDAEQFLKKKIKGSSFVRNPEKFMLHVTDIADICRDIVIIIKKNYGEDFHVDLEEIEIAGILHDIGSVISQNELHHSVIGAEYLENIGLPRIAKMISSHNFTKEILELKKFKDLNPDDFSGKTWNEIMITYASFHCGDAGVISFDEKFKRMYDNRDSFFKKVMKRGEIRVRKICQAVDDLKWIKSDLLLRRFEFA